MLSDNYGVGQRLINAHRYKTAVLEQIICSGLESASASLLSNICFKAGDITLTSVQHLKATIPVYKMSIKERRHRNTNPPFEWGWTDSSSFLGGSKLDEAAGLLAADGLLTTCNVWKRAEIYICCLVFI